jgi:hypothetical protein
VLKAGSEDSNWLVLIDEKKTPKLIIHGAAKLLEHTLSLVDIWWIS